jgi:peptide/nickel transport system permease protein
MKRFILLRSLYMMITLFAMVTIMFFLFRLMPGDPTMTVISPAMFPAAQEAMKSQFGLDRPLLEQYLIYLRNYATFDFGYSFHSSRSVSEMLAGRTVNTLVLILPSMILAYGLGALLGALLAWYRGGRTEIAAVLFATGFQAAPVFWVGMLAILFFSIHLGWFPPGHIVPPGTFFDNPWQMYLSREFLHHLALPFIVHTCYQICFPMLLMRSSMLNTIGDDFVEFARIKGLPDRRILFAHAARNSLLPVATTIPMIFGWALAGSVVIETVFSWPGLGLMMIEAVQRNDYPVVQAAFFLIALLTILGTFAADLLYGLLDPRIVYE